MKAIFAPVLFFLVSSMASAQVFSSPTLGGCPNYVAIYEAYSLADSAQQAYFSSIPQRPVRSPVPFILFGPVHECFVKAKSPNVAQEAYVISALFGVGIASHTSKKADFLPHAHSVAEKLKWIAVHGATSETRLDAANQLRYIQNFIGIWEKSSEE